MNEADAAMLLTREANIQNLLQFIAITLLVLLFFVIVGVLERGRK